mgnify:CR=1 FL=1
MRSLLNCRLVMNYLTEVEEGVRIKFKSVVSNELAYVSKDGLLKSGQGMHVRFYSKASKRLESD